MFTFPKRSLTSPKEAANRKPVQDLVTAVAELIGTLGPKANRAVRLGELVSTGALQYDENGNVVRGPKFWAQEQDPAGNAIAGDLWIWDGEVKKRVGDGWITLIGGP